MFSANVKILQLSFRECILTCIGIYKGALGFCYIVRKERKRERDKLTIHYRKSEVDCPVPGRMIVIVDLSTQV